MEDKYKIGGLIPYTRRGYRLPPIEMVRDYRGRLKLACDQSPVKKTGVPYYDKNGAWKATFDRFEKQNYLGGKKWMLKWNN